eukprot:COSAG06_NODE_512_length_14867_cov_28.794962_6_plen_80_part_00
MALSQRSMGRHDVAEPGRYEPPLGTGLPSDRANPYAPVRIAEQFEQLEPAETGGTRSLDDIGRDHDRRSTNRLSISLDL